MISGFANERILREYINKKMYNDYNKNIKDFLIFTFGDKLDENKVFIAEKPKGQVKPDILIKHNNVEKHISVKTGSGNSVHQENISVFFPFANQLIGETCLNCLKKFHFGDDTLDDTGQIRYSASECKKRYITEIKTLNKKINAPDNLSIFLDRFLFVGNISKKCVDVIYHGTLESGIWASRNEIITYVKNHTFSQNAIHFGPLTYQVWGRNENRVAVHPDRRYVMQIKWGSITKDLQQIRG